MKKNFNKWVYLVAAVITVIASSCANDEWDRHYNNTEVVLSDKSLSEYIRSQPEMEKFYQMMEISGYDSILDGSQTFTVWVPSNIALQNVDLTNIDVVKDLVMNHISRFSHSTSGVSSEKVYMLSKKFIQFAKTGGNYLFGKSPLTGLNISAKNGIIHAISGFEKYESNIWESLDRIEEIDSLRTFYKSFTMVDEFGVESNLILDYFGSLDNEDSLYTVLFPKNNAWIKSYDKIKNYYKMLPGKNSELLTRSYTNLAIITNNIFRTKFNPALFDSIISTAGNKFYNPSRLFANTLPVSASNGMIYVADSLTFDAKETWHNEIRIEAENAAYGRSDLNADLYPRNSEGTQFNTSKNRYIIVEPSTSSDISTVSAIFPIPNTLSAKYNIYCVFVPELIANANSHKPYTANFFIDYVDAKGVVKKNISLATNKTTDPDNITKMFIGEFSFPFCNIYDGNNTNISVKLKVSNTVKSNQTTTKSRTMRIDCIILEPVD